MKKITVLICSLSAAALAATGCNKPEENPNSNLTATNVANAEVTGTNDMSASSAVTATNPEAGGMSGAWQTTKEGASNAWSATKSVTTNAMDSIGQASSNAWQETKEISTNAWDKTKAAFSGMGSTNEVSTNYFAYDYSMKDSFVSEAQTNLVYFDTRIAQLSDQVTTGNNAKPDVQQDMQTVRDKRADLGAKLNAVQNATADNWNDAKADFTKSYVDLTGSLKTAWDSLKADM